MLKKLTVVCGLLLAATAAVAWEKPDSSGGVPVNVEGNAHLTWGDSLVWGMFPVSGASKTYIMTFPHTYEYVHHGDTLDSLGWDTTFTVGMHLHNTSVTFQWKGQPVVWFSGSYGDNPQISKLYWYSSDSAQSGQVVIDTFSFADGACIAYVPNEDYSSVYWPVPGWIYCLPGDTDAFWRYSIPAPFPPNLDPYGYYPGPGAVIADQAPTFMWGSTATPTYRLLVSTQSDFSDTVIDEQVSSPVYEPASNLPNGTYYWRTATWTGGAWSWCIGSRNFTLDGGWETVASIPKAPLQGGSCMAYDKGSFGTGVRSIVALVDGWGPEYVYRFDIGQNSWDSLDYAPEELNPGTSITTRAPVQDELASIVMAAFTGQNGDDAPYRYDYNQDPSECWIVWDDDSGDPFHNSYFPAKVDTGGSMVIGADDIMYLLPGWNTQALYWVDGPDTAGDGQQAGAVQRGRAASAHVVTSRDGIEIEYQLPASARVRAVLHDAVGRQVACLDAGEQQRGTHRLNWSKNSEGRRLSTGAYFVLLDIGTEQFKLKTVVK